MQNLTVPPQVLFSIFLFLAEERPTQGAAGVTHPRVDFAVAGGRAEAARAAQHHPSPAAVQECQQMLWVGFSGCFSSLPSFSWPASCGVSGCCSCCSACAALTAAGCRTPAAAWRTWKSTKDKEIALKCPILTSSGAHHPFPAGLRGTEGRELLELWKENEIPDSSNKGPWGHSALESLLQSPLFYPIFLPDFSPLPL